MKKFFIALSAAAMMLGVSSCKDGAASSEDAAFADSLATSFAQVQGTQLRMQTPQMKAQFGDSFNEDQFLKGFEAAAGLDTANVSYMIGYSIGIQTVYQANQWGKNGVKVNPKSIASDVVKAYRDTTINVQEVYMQFQELNAKLQQKIQAAEQAKAEAEAQKNLAEGEKFVAKQKQADKDIQTTASGLSYKIIAAGEGEKVSDNCEVEVKYVGKHIDGSEFDNSNGEAVKFNVNGVVPGFAEGLKLLAKGGKATLYVPGNLGYGPQGQPYAGIKSNEMLIFEVEVVGFTKVEESQDNK